MGTKRRESPYLKANCFSRLFYWYFNDLVLGNTMLQFDSVHIEIFTAGWIHYSNRAAATKSN